ncbi:MAG: HlyD family efflux transporter periplasmic adaptor subunit [Gammaproteobacteria bacterium]|nr:HlyD family efflux transporter periplasmic adaptor subunit [Gammaproteobacteria bacterium]
MKKARVITVSLLVTALVVSIYFFQADNNKPGFYYGYVEGEYLRIAAPVSAYLNQLHVLRGQTVTAGQTLFAMDITAAQAERDRAQAVVVKAKAELADLEKGERAEEVSVLQAQLEEAQAELARNELEFIRQQELITKNLTSESAFDSAKALRDASRARVRTLSASISVSRLPARDDRRAAARSAVHEAESSLAIAEHRLTELQPTVQVDALVEDTMYLPGEWVPANSVIVSLLPSDKIKLKFFVPQAEIAGLQPGTEIGFSCDGCPENLKAMITYIAPEAEYTPPVIYSAESRDKLVFLVEAKPNDAMFLPVGLPIEVAGSL